MVEETGVCKENHWTLASELIYLLDHTNKCLVGIQT